MTLLEGCRIRTDDITRHIQSDETAQLTELPNRRTVSKLASQSNINQKHAEIGFAQAIAKPASAGGQVVPAVQ